MGDAGDFADVGRFMRSPEGQAALEAFEQSLIGARIMAVYFMHNSAGVGVSMTVGELDEDLDFAEVINSFSVEEIRRKHMRVLEREYRKDFPAEHRKSASATPVDLADFRCPKCGAREAFAIETWQRMTFHRDGTTTEGDEGQQWDNDSPCRCDTCNHEGVVQDYLEGDRP